MKKIILLYIIINICLLKAQQISYTIPDIGSPGMNSYIEIIGPAGTTNNFGNNGIFPNNSGDNYRIDLVNAADNRKIVFGPMIVTWNGRMIASQAFVNQAITPNSEYWYNLTNEFRIPFRVYINGSYSNIDTFYIVKPFTFLNLPANTDRILGQQSLGVRSRRGAMIVNSMDLANSSYSISMLDCDPIIPGNQAYLPFILLCK